MHEYLQNQINITEGRMKQIADEFPLGWWIRQSSADASIPLSIYSLFPDPFIAAGVFLLCASNTFYKAVPAYLKFRKLEIQRNQFLTQTKQG